ncbi:MAG: VOC family protein [Saprospiraceae bacterium]
MQTIFPVKFQHLVVFVKDLVESHRWYRKLFKLQFSAQNDPNGSAIQAVSNQYMHFFSFGYYHHDMCFVVKPGIIPDNSSMLNYAVRLRDEISIADFIKILDKEKVTNKKGRLLKSAKSPDNLQAVTIKDPNGYWVEVLGK